MLIRLTTLGAVRVHRADAPVADLPAQRLRFALLLYLAMEQDVSREEVVAMFWPDRDTARGKHALRQMLYELRQVLGEEWIDLSRDRIVTTIDVDAAQFESAAQADRIDTALALYGGPFLLGFSLDNRSFEAWVDRRGAHLARVHRRLQRDNMARLVADGRTEDAVGAARRWVELDPLDDEAAHALIERLVAAGQRTAALRHYEKYERQLAAELQVEPLDETRTLIASIRSGDALPQAPAEAASVARQAPSGKGRSPADPPAPSGADVPSAAAGSQPTDLSGAASRDPLTPPARDPSRGERKRRPALVAIQRRPIEVWRTTGGLQRAAAVMMLAAVMLAVGFYARAGQAGSPAAERRASVAVLPFNDNSMDGSMLPLANVLTEDLARSLARSRSIEVISPNGVRLKRAQGAPEDSLGRMLGADYLVGGGVTRYEDRVVVDVELLDGRSGRVVRSEKLERPYSESRNLVDDVVRGAAVFLRREVGSHLDIVRAESGAGNERAFRLMLEAEDIQRPIVTLLGAGDRSAALALLSRADSVLALAADIDRDWVQPLVQRGRILERRAFIARLADPGDVATRRSLYDEGLKMAARAAHRGADHAAVHALRGALLRQIADLPGLPADSVTSSMEAAEAALTRAADLDPSNQTVWRLLADLLNATGRHGEALVAAETGYRIDPYGPDARSLTHHLFTALFETGADREAHGWCSQGAADYEGDLVFLYCTLALHAWGDAIEPRPDLMRRELLNFQQRDRRGQPGLLPRFETMIAAAHARAGQTDSARAILRRVAETSDDTGVLWMRASVHALLQEDSIALELLEQYLDVGGLDAPRVALSRPFWHLRERTELQRLIEGRDAERISRNP